MKFSSSTVIIKNERLKISGHMRILHNDLLKFLGRLGKNKSTHAICLAADGATDFALTINY